MPELKKLSAIASEVSIFMVSRGILTQTELSKVSGVHQPTISRLLHGELRRIGKEVKRLCDYANISIYEDVDPSSNATLMAALREVWDGSDEDALRIASVLHSVAAMRGGEVRRRLSKRAKGAEASS